MWRTNKITQYNSWSFDSNNSSFQTASADIRWHQIMQWLAGLIQGIHSIMKIFEAAYCNNSHGQDKTHTICQIVAKCVSVANSQVHKPSCPQNLMLTDLHFQKLFEACWKSNPEHCVDVVNICLLNLHLVLFLPSRLISQEFKTSNFETGWSKWFPRDFYDCSVTLFRNFSFARTVSGVRGPWKNS